MKQRFGIIAVLNKGHAGIFEVSMNDKVVYTNLSRCGLLPTDQEVLNTIKNKPQVVKPLENKAFISCG
jgi:hypothetical protein